ncbi:MULTISPECIES: N-acyl-D-amino-acid deacylase family protein [Sphingobium]|uniref:N-acyl-D-amino-acid deacylase family protein n=1 Tax=Sphingobium TaxID=165695 RepID=UPI00159C82E2|nr:MULTISPECIES: amidohydrolase family protein [unclassified Sphingobium]
MNIDVVVRGGTVIDGTGEPARLADIGIRDGKVVEIGAIPGQGAKEIDARGLIVAPGIIDLHTHYDAQLHWDPYCTTSGWHGTTTVVIGNCGFSFAPVRKGMSERYMRMMENTEQVPFEAMASTMDWTWESFPDWIAHLKSLPKGLNVATYLPMNPLLSYVVGPDEAKKRPCTVEERKQMRDLLHEAMDAGASGFALSFMGEGGNNHLDHDQSPMPTDAMDAEEAYNLARVLAERGEGTIQILCELPGMDEPRRYAAEELARISGRPVLHNILLGSDTDPEQHRGIMRWLDRMQEEKLDIWSQCFSFRKPLEITPLHYNVWDSVAAFRRLSMATTAEAKMTLVQDPAYRKTFIDNYDPREMSTAGGRLEAYMIVDPAGSASLEGREGQLLGDIARDLGKPVAELFLDTLIESNMHVMFSNNDNGTRNVETIEEILSHPRVLAGISDGGAHSKHGNGGYWSTDLILWLTQEGTRISREQVHSLLSYRNARAFGLTDRGLLQPGYAADLMIYDADKLDYQPRGHYEVVHDLPGGDWRKVTRAIGIRHILVNGVETFTNGKETGATPGEIVMNQRADAKMEAAQ